MRVRLVAVFGLTAAMLIGGAGPAGAATSSRTMPAAGVVGSSRVGSELPVGVAPTADGLGFWVAGADGIVTPEGDAISYGDASALALNAPVVSIAATASSHGYWMVASDGGIFAFGDAAFHGSTGNIHLNQPVVAMAST